MTHHGTSPAVQTSKKTIKYKESVWKIHRFSICSGETIADVEVLKMSGSLFIWIGCPGQHIFSELALGVPGVFEAGGDCARKAISTMLLGPTNSTDSSGLARRLASALQKPVYVSCNLNMDRFMAPLVEKGLNMEIKNSAHCF